MLKPVQSRVASPEMPGKRSPNCPAHDLEESIDRVSAIYRIEGRNSFSGAIAVMHMGYNGLNGASRRALGAVRAFGLLEGRGEQLRVSDEAVLIIADAGAEDQQERKEALLRALCHNRVFADLYEHFAGQVSASLVSAFLQKKYRFKPVTADSTAGVYQRSAAMLQADAVPAGHSETQSVEKGKPSHSEPVEQGGDVEAESAGHLSPYKQSVESRRDSFTLENGTAYLSWPTEMSAGEFEDFTDWLILEHRKISRKVKGENGPLIERRKENSAF